MRIFYRSSGLLLHITSLPEGNLGEGTYQFIDFLKSSGQSLWQVLPIQATCDGSPYNLSSAFAGNPAFISQPKNKEVDKDSLSTFIEKNKYWLEDYALFSILKKIHNNQPWCQWEKPLRSHEQNALSEIKRKYGKEIESFYVEQHIFYSQWNELREHCRKNGISLLGDIPLYMACESADVWAHQEIFDLDKEGKPKAVAGVPPDYFNPKGQLWGNPLYRWDLLRTQGYNWWLKRLAFSLELFDVLRLDHFIGFIRYWRIPPQSQSAQEGVWVEGPGTDFFEKIFETLDAQQFVTENLGSLTPEVESVRLRFHLPGMKVFQFLDNPQELSQIPKETILYTGTHDNDTLVGWLKQKKGTDTSGKAAVSVPNSWEIIELVYNSPANTVIIPVQDILELDSQARMNTPGKSQGNWLWRLDEKALTPAIAQRLKLLTANSGRLPL